MLVVDRALAYGRRAAVFTVLGNTMGASIQVAVVAVGSGALVAESIVLFTAIPPQFVSRGSGHVPAPISMLGLVYSAIALVSDSTWAVAAGTFRSWFARSPRRLQLVGGVGGLAVVAVGIRLALSGGATDGHRRRWTDTA